MKKLNKKMLKVNTRKKETLRSKETLFMKYFFLLFCFVFYMDELDWPVADCSGRDIHCCYLSLRSKH